jgi:hypothetical protein
MVKQSELINLSVRENRAVAFTKLAQEKIDKLRSILKYANDPFDIWHTLKPEKRFPEEPIIEDPVYPSPPEFSHPELPFKPDPSKFRTSHPRLNFKTKEPNLNDIVFWKPYIFYMKTLINFSLLFSFWLILIAGW